MRNRVERLLKLACLLLGAALTYFIVLAILHGNPLANVKIPALPSLADTNAPADGKATNAIAIKPASRSGTNPPIHMTGTNSVTNVPIMVAVTSTNANTNSIARAGTNLVTLDTNAPAAPKALTSELSTNAVAAELSASTNVTTGSVVQAAMLLPATNSTATEHSATEISPATNNLAQSETNAAATNVVLVGTNAITNAVLAAQGTNHLTMTNSTAKSNGVAHAGSITSVTAGSRSVRPVMGMPGRPGMSRLPELPPDAQARIDRIYESELLGQVMHPMPMALLGIAGNCAFLRSATGQTGMVKEGDSLGTLKLLRIGINRVLVEENGQKQELMIFNGYGGESLLSKKETPDEKTPK